MSPGLVQEGGLQPSPGFFAPPPASTATLPFSSASSPATNHVESPASGVGNDPGAGLMADPSRPSGQHETIKPSSSFAPAGSAPMDFKAIQLYDAYLVMETPEGMLVIDQHALHERILFEQLKRRLRTGQLESQRMLIPEPVDLPAEQAAKALEQRDDLAELGLGLEDFGGGTVLLTMYPAIR